MNKIKVRLVDTGEIVWLEDDGPRMHPRYWDQWMRGYYAEEIEVLPTTEIERLAAGTYTPGPWYYLPASAPSGSSQGTWYYRVREWPMSDFWTAERNDQLRRLSQ